MLTQPKEYGVYFLRDPRDGIVRYIGMTANQNVRQSNHWSSRLTDYVFPLRMAWLRELDALGLRPVFEVIIGGLSKQRAALVERRLILLHSQVYGPRLLQKAQNVKRSQDGRATVGYKPEKSKPALITFEVETGRILSVERYESQSIKAIAAKSGRRLPSVKQWV